MKSRHLVPVFAWLLLMLFSLGLKAQAAEPTVQEIYQTATRGDLPRAQQMIDQVVQAHPDSGKAHFVKAELAARANDAATARTELQAAERLAPGLPFVRAEAASALRSRIEGMSVSGSAAPATSVPPDTRRMGAPSPSEAAPRSATSGFSLAPILMIGLPIAAFLMWRRRRKTQVAPAAYEQPGYGPAPSVDPGTSFGRRDMVHDRYGRPVYPQGQGYETGAGAGGPGPGAYPAQRGGGLGSSIAGGLAGGLAMGAGVVAAQEIGRRMLDRGPQGNPSHEANTGAHAADSQIARDAGLGSADPSLNNDMGGQDFGITGGAGWDDAGGGSLPDVGGDDWN